MLKKIRVILPLLLFLSIVVVLWRGLSLHPNHVPSPLIGKSAPTFTLPTLDPNKVLTNKDLIGHVTLLNVWASWCYACAQEHAFLLKLAKEKYLTLYGLSYKDEPDKVKKWLDQNGNPFQMIGLDKTGKVAIDWGVYGAPETFILDKKGIIRYKQIGPLTQEIWDKNLKPLVDILQM